MIGGIEMNDLEIILVVNKDKISSIRWSGGNIDTNIEIDDLPPTIKTCISLAEEQSPPILSDKYLEEFLDPDYRTDRQMAIIKVLVSERNWLSREEVADKVGQITGEKLIPHNLAGPLGGLTNTLRTDGKEEIIEIKWIKGGGEEHKCYQLKQQYKDKIRDIIKRRWK